MDISYDGKKKLDRLVKGLESKAQKMNLCLLRLFVANFFCVSLWLTLT